MTKKGRFKMEEELKAKIELSLKEVHDTDVLNCIYQLIYFHVFDFRKSQEKTFRLLFKEEVKING